MGDHHRPSANRVINICFHGIGEPGRALEPGEDPYWVTAELYAAILDEIAGWPKVAISFDDGNASDADIGMPALLERGLSASFFVLAGRLDAPGSLSTAQVRALVANGMTVGSHGMHHRPWTGLDAGSRTEELVTARGRLADAAGVPIDRAACPLGRYDRSVLRELAELGYSRVYTSDRLGAGADDWLQPRYSVTASDTAAVLRSEVLERQSLVHRIKPLASSFVKRRR